MVEGLDAAQAVRHVDLSDRDAFKAALGATLVKNQRHYRAFDTAFDVYFGLLVAPEGSAPDDEFAGDPRNQEDGGGGDGPGVSDDLIDRIIEALIGEDDAALRSVVRDAVRRHSGMEPGRPVGGRYYFYRVMRRLDADQLLARLAEILTASGREPRSDLDVRLLGQQAEELLELLRTELRREIARRLVADRGAGAVAKTLRVPLVEDIDLMHATREELAEIDRAVTPLARKLATRLAQRRRRGRRGRLDVRRTIRRSLSHGGVMLDPSFRPPRTSKPELVLLCDVSGSMATFARFTMQLTYSIAHQFSKVRSFAFIDGVAEVTRYFGPGINFHDSLLRMGVEANLVWRDGHSDYGNAIAQFWERYSEAVTTRSTVIITGDARNNYRTSSSDVFAEIVEASRVTFWLNPEARRYWDTGDSIMSTYGPLSDGIYQVRSLRELESFVEQVALPVTKRPRHVEVATSRAGVWS